jgi:hypothetical protein
MDVITTTHKVMQQSMDTLNRIEYFLSSFKKA